MNGFISKYRWLIVIVAGGLVAALAYYTQQDDVPVVVTENSEAVATVKPAEPKVITPVTAESAPPEEVASVVAVPEESFAPVEEAVVEVQDAETPPTDPVENVEETTPEEVVVEEPAEVVPAEQPIAEEIVPEQPAEEATLEVVAEEIAPEVVPESTPSVEPEAAVDTPADEAGNVTSEEQTVQNDAQTTEVAAVIEEVTNTITAAGDEEPTDAIKPSFDVVRVDPTGSAVIAGTAEPYSKVVILSNGEDIGDAIAGSSGEFVAIIQVPDSEQGQTLELESEISGKLLFSDETILILPVMRSDAADTISDETAPPIIRASADEIVIVQGAPQLALGQVSLDSISYDENDEVVLAGRGNPGSAIVIYVDDTHLMDTVVSNSGGWKQALTGLDAGRYVLRVDEVDADGTVTSRVESPFQRSYPEDVRDVKASNETTYTVQPGNSLWLIATGRYGEGMQYMQIFSANKDQIRDPDLIYPGQVFAIPDAQE